MIRYIQFAFLREGSSDDGLLAHLESLLVREGADEAVGEVRSYGGTTQEKIEKFLEEALPVHAIFVHRDADKAGPTAREREIFNAGEKYKDCPPLIPVVPVTMTESWLLVEELAIRQVAGNPTGRQPLHIPPLSAIENVSDAKARLKQAIADASGYSGSKLSQLNDNFDRNRAAILNRLDPDGPVTALPSWSQLEQDVRDFLSGSPRFVEK